MVRPTENILVDYTKGHEALYVDDLKIEGRLLLRDIELVNDDYASGVRVTFHSKNVRVLRTLEEDLALIKAIGEQERRAAMSDLERRVEDIWTVLNLPRATSPDPWPWGDAPWGRA